MRKTYLFPAIIGLFVFSACQKDLPGSSDQNIAEAQLSSRAGGNELQNGNREIIFYALGEGNRLDKFNSYNADNILSSTSINVSSEVRIIAIDFRPATGQLYGLGSNSRIYVINPETGGARVIGTAPFTPALVGTVAGFDFNPTVDRIRVVTSTGQNLRINPETGAVANVDGSINGVANAMITSVAYLNNIAGASTTTLFDIDVTTDKLYRQFQPNAGTLVEVGSLNIDLSGEGGFDIAPPVSGAKDVALALYQTGQKSTLLSIDLTSGKAKKIEKFNDRTVYYGIAIPTLPVAYAVSGSNLLIFNPENPGIVVSKAITGVGAGESIVGLDFRPINGQLHAISNSSTASRIYTINAASGAAAFIATLTTQLSGTSFGVDFNPVVDRIRIVSNTGQNLRVVPTTAAAGTTAVDGNLNPGTPNVTAAAYENNFAGTTSTKLYVIDTQNDKLYIQNPPNSGTLVAVSAVGLGVDIEANNGYDIGGTSNIGYGIFTSAGVTKLYTVDSNSGVASPIGNFTNMVTGFTIGLGF